MIKDAINLKLETKPEFKVIPETPGVYIYSDKNKNILYVGKAKNLRSRLRSYFSLNLLEKTKILMQEAKFLSYIKVSSELEALLLEARLVKAYKPFFNSNLKDDKHPLYIKITREKYPRVITARKNDRLPYLSLYGPFPSTNTVYSVLFMLRRIFPYSQHKLGKKACIYKQLGLCNPCPNEIEYTSNPVKKNDMKRLYLKNIHFLKLILDGKLIKLKTSLYKQMKSLSKQTKYEEAQALRDKIKRLEYITQPINNIEGYLDNPNLAEDINNREITEFNKILSPYFKLNKLERIECYDVAHLAGSEATASMVVFIKGTADKSFYRKLKIYQKNKMSDTDSLSEVAKRRVKHFSDWGIPDLIIVDGGRAQVSAFKKAVANSVPVVGIAKRLETLVIPYNNSYREIRLKGNSLYLVQRIRDEAHRFARRYHHLLISKSLLPNAK